MIGVLQLAVERYPAHGFGKLFKIIRRWGHDFNHKRVHRIYCALGLNKRRRGKKRIPSRDPVTRQVPEKMNQCWSMDFSTTACSVADAFGHSMMSMTSIGKRSPLK